MHYLIIGNCAAGINAIEGIRKLDGSGEITVVSDEDFPAYCRCLITDYVAAVSYTHLTLPTTPYV